MKCMIVIQKDKEGKRTLHSTICENLYSTSYQFALSIKWGFFLLNTQWKADLNSIHAILCMSNFTSEYDDMGAKV